MAATGEETVALLERVSVFEALEHDDLQKVAEVAVPRSFDAGDAVFREGDDSHTCYIVRSGHARAVRANTDGRTITLANFGPGDIFGELAMFDGETRSATVEAVDDIELVGILAADMQRLIRTHPDLAGKLVVGMGRRLREANARLARQSFQTVQSRVAQVVSQLVQQQREETGGGVEGGDIQLTVTQSDIAQLAGSSRESASRFLAVLERAGAITQGRGRITVHDAAALDGYVF